MIDLAIEKERKTKRKGKWSCHGVFYLMVTWEDWRWRCGIFTSTWHALFYLPAALLLSTVTAALTPKTHVS